MRVLIREGSVSKDLHALQPVLTDTTAPYMCLCTDDRNPLDIDPERLDDLQVLGTVFAGRWFPVPAGSRGRGTGMASVLPGPGCADDHRGCICSAARDLANSIDLTGAA